MLDLYDASILDLQAGLKDGSFTSVQLTKASRAARAYGFYLNDVIFRRILLVLLKSMGKSEP